MSEQRPPAEAPVKELSGRIGKYAIIRPLGKGAMGMVYLANDALLERNVALKVMVAQIADDPELKQRFEREAKAVAKLTHPNVVTVFDLGYHEGAPYIAMEYLDGLDLQKTMRQPPPMTVERKVLIIIKVLAGLGRAHQNNIIHRDIKPANIFILKDGSVKIMDFGVARLTTASMTGTGNIVGTADYMSPEQVKGAKVDGRSDLFSVGCLLYELLAGRRPFHSENLMAIFYKITHEEPNYDLIPAGEEYESLLPILKKALHKDQRQRYQRAYEFEVDLREWLKAHASSPAGQHALESLGDLEAPPTGVPASLTSPGGTVGSVAGMDVSTAGRRATGGTLGATARVGASATVAGTRAGSGTVGPTIRPGATQYAPAVGSTVLRPTRPEPAAGNPMLYVALGGLTVALLGAGGFIYWSRQQAASDGGAGVAQLPGGLPSAAAPSAPPSAEAAPPPEASPLAPPPTPAPAPTFGEATGKGAASLQAAQSAFRASNYERALAAAQEALREDPDNADAAAIVERSLAGQKAEARLRAAEAALRQGDHALATSEAEAARGMAPWDARITSLMGRIRDAQQQAASAAQAQRQAQIAAQLSSTLGRADEALAQQRYDAAISLYEEVLKVDPNNQRATLGRTSALGARAVAQAAAQGATRPAGRSFVMGKTVAQGLEAGSGSVPEGFEESAGVTVKRGTQAAELPGRIGFEFSPESVKPGDRYSVNIVMLNEGAAPIQIKGMTISTTVNGRRSQGAVPPLAKTVAPKQKTVIYSLSGEIWKEDTTSWSMEVTVQTARGETYRNQVTWK
jgi:tRNA A-37 threonylcarbamoyl transferase component Bud32/tetratricopeptide (TPR) repeat protein